MATDKDMLEESGVSPWYSVGKILPTSQKVKTCDAFELFRPTRQCVDYNVSQTWIKMQKGDLKVNVKHTSATYKDIPLEICNPKKKKKIKRFSGGPPQWKFVNELWMEQVEENQKKLRKEHKKAMGDVTVHRATKHRNLHVIAQALVGPDWFMELSPKQLEAIDRLPCAIIIDLCKQSTVNCEKVLAILGLVLRPNKYHIRKALKHSCADPVEFLLVLYQLLNPQRERYSLNDRLLLSSVVHLSIRDTLKELHVRIPSPPRLSQETRPTHAKAKHKKYTSPYLKPLTYCPAPPKFSGVYKNKHIQHPENRYFNYENCIEENRKNILTTLEEYSRDTSDKVQEFLKEYKNAQQFYESVPGVQQAMLTLIPPTIKKLCPNMLHPRTKDMSDPRFLVSPLVRVSSSETFQCFCESELPKNKPTQSSCEEHVKQYLESLCLCGDCSEKTRQANLIRIHGGFRKSICCCEEAVPLIQGTLTSSKCECLATFRDKITACVARQKLSCVNCVLGDVFITKLGPVYNVLAVRGKKICLCAEIIQRTTLIRSFKEKLHSNECKFVLGGVIMTKIGPIYNLMAAIARQPCQCIKTYRQKLGILLVQNRVRTHPVAFVNNGLILGKLGPVFNFLGVCGQKSAVELRETCSCEIVKPKCFQACLDYLEYKTSQHCIPSTSSSDSSTSSSRSESTEQGLNCSPQAQTTSCRKIEASTSSSSSPSSSNCSCSSSTSSSSSSSSSTTDNRKPSSDEKEPQDSSCACKDELERFMKSKCICEECNMKIRQEYATYVMGGAVKSPTDETQVNLVQGVYQRLCSCLHDHLVNIQKVDEYKARIKARYDLKKKPNKYCIGGVKNTLQGPVYLIAGMRPPVECECARAIRERDEAEATEKQRAKPPKTGRLKYEISGVKAMPNENIYIISKALKIEPCICEKLLEKFETAHKSCLDTFEEFIRQCKGETEAFVNEVNDEDQASVATNLADGFATVHDSVHVVEEVQPSSIEEVNEEIGADDKEEEKPSSTSSESEEETTSEDNESSTSTDDEEAEESSINSKCLCCRIDNPPDVTPITIPTNKELAESFLSKRFAIFRQIPTCKKSLIKVVRHILQGMAEDGFALAKLPDVHKLPIFKLWVERRCDVFWTYEDKVKSCAVSKFLWKHTDLCYKRPTPSRMPYTIAEARRMTWRNAEEIKRIAAEKSSEFYRGVKQMTVDHGREFFATTFDYEFPTKTWRECAFAYLPTKEEDLFPYKIVQPHDARCVPDNKKIHCYC